MLSLSFTQHEWKDGFSPVLGIEGGYEGPIKPCIRAGPVKPYWQTEPIHGCENPPIVLPMCSHWWNLGVHSQ